MAHALSLSRLHDPFADGDAPSRPSVDRRKLLSAMIDLCEAGQGQASDEARALIDDIFMDLIRRAERDLRQRLAARLADAAWAPSGLVNALALDDIEIARPVIAKSPVLKDHDLVRLLTEATIEHQIEVARRPNLGAPVVEAILDQGDPAVLTTLAGNASAEVSDCAMFRLVSLAREIAALRIPLARHPRLTAELAYALYVWVGETLKNEIVDRFEVNRDAFEAAMQVAVAESVSGAPMPEASAAPGEDDVRQMEVRLVAKLQAAGELKAGFLLRALREGKLHLFQVALACLAGVRTEDVQTASDSERPELLALACAHVGIDRSVFPTILSLVRALNQGRPVAGVNAHPAVHAAFSHKIEGEALAAFREGLAAP